MFTRFKDLRVDRDLRQVDVASFLCITQAQYSYVENNKFQLDYSSLIKLALFYDCSIDYILGLTNEVKPYPRCRR